MPSRLAMQAAAAIAALVFTLGLWIDGTTPSPGWLRFFSATVLAISLVFLLWDQLLWRVALVQKMTKVPRSVRGTWKGTLSSQWVDPTTNRTPDPKDVYLVVRQTASSATVTLLTNESRSTSSLATVCSQNGSWSLDYQYLNTPDLSVEHQSRMHHGSASLHIAGKPVSRLRGRYWTTRDSKGELDFNERVSTLADDHAEARKLFE